MKTNYKFDIKVCDTLKMNAGAVINRINFGNFGSSYSCAKIMHSLFYYHFNFNINDLNWVNRDRFVLCNQSELITFYAQLRMLDLLNIEDLKQLDKYKDLQYPILNREHLLDATATNAGQGLAIAVGLAWAESYLSSSFKEINHYTYALCSDADLQDGIALEALSFAGTHQLNKLIILYDSNGVQSQTYTSSIVKENIKLKFKAIGFKYIVCENKVSAIVKTISKAKRSNKPTFIEVKTLAAEGTPKEGAISSDNYAPSKDELSSFKDNSTFKKADNFDVDDEIREKYIHKINKKANKINRWNQSEKLKYFLEDQVKINLNSLILDENKPTIKYSEEIITHLTEGFKNIVLLNSESSSNTNIKAWGGIYSHNNKSGNNLILGARELSKGFIANGIALHSNLRPIIASSLNAIEYLKLSMQNAEVMNLSNLYLIVKPEENIDIKPRNNINSLRSINNINIFKPLDELEVKTSFENHFNHNQLTAIVIENKDNIINTNE
ncbi:Transketolase [Metamycoplasma cloacale]|uniref:Uncharacterized protein n=1 Tax=Metamycoplasma cloacale TaxID=92401 RepID=A0A2Z4LM32_9BACT|nr:hypothetical protein [Metamycoplasma cloacale]AWX42832.1 hypothetical protein DK849_02010 [Metamycoplasma cloacale]VEU79349.1 Transketolase [Metamycoplasma cloacale]